MKAKISLTPLEKTLREKHTKITQVVVGGQDEPGFCCWLTVGNQSFCVTPNYCDTKEEAEWMRDMLAKALASIIRENS